MTLDLSVTERKIICEALDAYADTIRFDKAYQSEWVSNNLKLIFEIYQKVRIK